MALTQVPSPMLAPGTAGNGPAFSAYKSVDQNFTTGVATKVTYETEDFDTASCFASSRFTPNVAGYYALSATCFFNRTFVAEIWTAVYKSGSLYKYLNDTLSSASNQTYQNGGSCLVYLNGTTDYVEIYALQGSGSTQNTNTTAAATTWFQGYLVRAA